jgi:ArsR family transcriptional regulator
MLQLIARSGEALCVCDLEEHVPLSQPTVSHHLKILAEAGILTRERRGRWAYYSIDESRLGEMQLDLSALA